MSRSLVGETALDRPSRAIAARLGHLRLRRLGRRVRADPAPPPSSGARASLVRAPARALLAHRRLALALAIGLALLAGGWLWLRHSSLVAVEHVRVAGVAGHGPEAQAIDAALEHAARSMSTLDVKTAALSAAVASFPVVSSVTAQPSFPHGLRIEVSEQPPVAALEVAGARTALAADGVSLGAHLLSGSLPVVHLGAGAEAVLPLAGHSVHEGALLSQLGVLGAAPRPLASLITRVYMGPHGVTIALASRVLVFFGDATRPHAKWLSLARVLADASSAGATYVDVRVPERPAAGFAPGTKPGLGSEGEPSSSTDPTTAAALAAGLESAVAGGANPDVSAASTAGNPESPGTTGGEASSASGSEASSASGGEASGGGGEASAPRQPSTSTAGGAEGASQSGSSGG